MHKNVVIQTIEFQEWFDQQPLKTQVVVAKRIEHIIEDDHFGDHKNVSEYDTGVTKNQVFELRWHDGKRVYFGKIGQKLLLLLYGGNKNGQDKDIKKAKALFVKYIKRNFDVEKKH